MRILHVFVFVCGVVLVSNAQQGVGTETLSATTAKVPVVEKNVRLRGNVTQAKKPLEGISVKVVDEQHKEYFAKTDSNGRYELKLPVGRYRVSASQPIAGSVDCYTVVENLVLRDKKRFTLNLDLNICGCG